jgi:hypothetical protein
MNKPVKLEERDSTADSQLIPNVAEILVKEANSEDVEEDICDHLEEICGHIALPSENISGNISEERDEQGCGNNNNTFTWSGPSGVLDCTGQRPGGPAAGWCKPSTYSL